MTAYRIGDIPAEALSVMPTQAGDDLELSPFTGVTVSLFDPTGTLVSGSGLTAAISGESVNVSFPTTAVFDLPGIYNVSLTLTATHVAVTADETPIVVEQPDGWHTLASIRARYGYDFPSDDAYAWTLLDTAKTACVSWAPALADGETVPSNYREAQALQARNTLNALKTDPSTGADGTLAVIRPFPLDNFIKSLLRPRTVWNWG